MIESALVTYKGKVISYSTGSAGSVEFDFLAIWDTIKEDKNDINTISNIVFFHVHPEGFLDLSETDKNCVKGLFMAIGKPFLFSIITFNTSDVLDISFKMKCFICDKDSVKELHSLPSNSNLFENMVDSLATNRQLEFLKYLSYGCGGIF
jgi:hypothetical protein